MSYEERSLQIRFPESCIGCGEVKPDIMKKITREKAVYSVERPRNLGEDMRYKMGGYRAGPVPKDVRIDHYDAEIHLCGECSRNMRRHQVRNLAIDLLLMTGVVLVLSYSLPRIPVTLGIEKQILLYGSVASGIFAVGVVLDLLIALDRIGNPYGAYYSAERTFLKTKFSFFDEGYSQVFRELNPRIEDVDSNYPAFNKSEGTVIWFLFFALIMGLIGVGLIQFLLGSIFPWLLP
ncbi:MAG: hypothetical protein ACFFET_15180 [Candidatus Thorarchaeota archaeon]